MKGNQENIYKKKYEELKKVCENFLTNKINKDGFVEKLYEINESFERFKEMDGRK